MLEHRGGEGEEAETELARRRRGSVWVPDELARTVSVRVDERGDGAVSALAPSAAELQLMGPSPAGACRPRSVA